MEDPVTVVEQAVVEPVVEPEIDALALKDAEIEKLREEKENYKKVALKRLGKLDNDAEFLAGTNDTGLTVEEQVKATLIDREISRAEQEKDLYAKKLAKENAELRLALKNRPGDGLGNGSGPSTEVKDNVFSAAQLIELEKRAERIGADPKVYIENAKKNILSRS